MLEEKVTKACDACWFAGQSVLNANSIRGLLACALPLEAASKSKAARGRRTPEAAQWEWDENRP